MLTLDQLQRIMPRLPAAKAAEYLPHLNAAMEEFGINTPAREAAILAQLSHESGELTRLEEMPWTEWRCERAGCRWRGREPGELAFRRVCPKCKSGGWLREVKYPDCYEGRESLGNTQPGDGVRFKGRGPIMLTGRANYAAASRALYPGAWACRGCGLGFCAATPPSQPHCGSGVWETFLERHADHVLLPEVGFRVAGWFWATHTHNGVALNELADMVAEALGFGAFCGTKSPENAPARARFDRITRAINGGLRGANERWTYYLRAREVLGQPQDKEEGRTT